MEDKIGQLSQKYKKYAEKNGFKLNPNKKMADGIIHGLFENEKKHGKKYCPCRRVTGNKEEDKKIICPCEYHKEEISEQGYCHCRLFVR